MSKTIEGEKHETISVPFETEEELAQIVAYIKACAKFLYDSIVENANELVS
jgi:hypothetical protein